VGLYVYIKGLGLELRVGWVVDTWNGSSTAEMVQVSCELGELSPCALFLKVIFIADPILIMSIKQFSDLLVFLFNMVEVLLASEEIVLVFSAVVASETSPVNI
jgi:hypothetical protein